MKLTFSRLGLDQNRILEAQKFGLKYKNYQKKQLLSANAIGKPTPTELDDFINLYPEAPLDYLTFLREVNGGVPSLNVLKSNGRQYIIREFYALSSNKSIPDSIYFQVNRFGRSVASSSIPIAETGNGDAIFLECRAATDCNIIIFSHDDYNDSSGSQIAGSFSELLSMLTGPV